MSEQCIVGYNYKTVILLSGKAEMKNQKHRTFTKHHSFTILVLMSTWKTCNLIVEISSNLSYLRFSLKWDPDISPNAQGNFLLLNPTTSEVHSPDNSTRILDR